MEYTTEEQAIFDGVYNNRMEFFKQHPKGINDLRSWAESLKGSKPIGERRHEVAREATIKAYEDQIKILQLRALIEE